MTRAVPKWMKRLQSPVVWGASVACLVVWLVLLEWGERQQVVGWIDLR